MTFAISFILFSAFLASCANANPQGCVDGDGSTDLFPDKVKPLHSKHWSVEYKRTYKILTNKAAGETYILHQCGTTFPSVESGKHDARVQIPLNNVGLGSTTMIPFVELLGERESIAAFFGSASWVSSPCLSQLFDQGKVTEVKDADNANAISNPNLPAFVSHDDTVAYNHAIQFSESQEDTNLAVFEWIKVYALFFNKEEEANEIFNAVRNKYQCGKRNADLLSCDVGTKPVVLWGSYSSYCGGWSVAKCPNYYCEFAAACDARILFDNTGGSFASEACGINYMTTAEFVAFGKDADYWIYTAPDFGNTLSKYGSQLSGFKSVKNQKVFDTEGSGGNAWFEQRLAEPDVILQDFCQIVGYENPKEAVRHKRRWLRNVFKESVGSLGQCQSTSAPLKTRGTACEALPADDYCPDAKKGYGQPCSKDSQCISDRCLFGSCKRPRNGVVKLRLAQNRGGAGGLRYQKNGRRLSEEKNTTSKVRGM